MAIGWQKGTLFAGGLLLGVGLGAWAVVGPLHAVHGPVPVPQPQADAAAVPVADLKVAAGPLRCDLDPIVPKAGADDGRKALQPHPGGATAAEVSAQLLAGKEAAASGHHRDAEVAFLNACHSAQVVPSHDDALVADADYQLARLYGNLAITGGPHAGELRQRAQELYGATLSTYRTRYGDDNEKTRFAAHGLAMLEQKFQDGGTTKVVATAPAHDKPEAAAAPAPKREAHAAPKPRAVSVSHADSRSSDAHAPSPPDSDAAAAPTPKPRETVAAIPLAQHTAVTPKPRETLAAVPLAQRTQRATPQPPSPSVDTEDRSSDSNAQPAPRAQRPARHSHRDDPTASTDTSASAPPSAPVGTASGDAHAGDQADDTQ
jgi:hypothetical protein